MHSRGRTHRPTRTGGGRWVPGLRGAHWRVLLAVGLAAALPHRIAAQAPSDTLDVAVLENWPPHYQVLANGTATGFAVDVARAVAENQGLTLRFVPFSSFPEAIDALADGSVDVIPDFGLTPSREATFLFTRAFDAFRISVFVRESYPDDRDGDDFAGRRIGTVRSNAGVDLVATLYPEAERVVFDNVREALFELIAAGVDAVVYPEEVFVSLARSAHLEDRFRILTPPLAEIRRGMAVRAGDTLLLATLDRGVEALVGTPEYEAIVQRWFEPPGPFWTLGRALWFGGLLLLATLLGMAIWRYRSISTLAAELMRVLQERDAARDASRQEEERFRTVVETAFEGIVVADAQSRITLVNRRMCELVGQAEGDLLGRSITTLVDPEDEARLHGGMARRRQGISESYELRIQRADAPSFWAFLSVSPIPGPNGDFVGSVATIADITDRIEAERAVQESERRFRSLVEKASDLISTLDADGHMEYQSPPLGRILGYEADALRGRSVWDFVHPLDSEAMADIWADLLEAPGRSVQTGPFRFRHQDGSWRTLTATLTNLLDDPGVRAIVSNARDLTEQEELERRLNQSLRLEAVGRLAGGVAHDFNNLLTVIRSETDLILLDLETESPLAAGVQVVQTAADRAASLTSQLLSFSREQVLRPRVVRLCGVMEGMAGLLERVIGENIRIELDMPGDLAPIRIDANQLEQVVLNLALNARDAMPNGGVLRMSTYEEDVDAEGASGVEGLRPGRYTVLCVADTGTGMDERTRERAFEPFFTTKDRDKGTGLGLAMAYGFVTQSGGSIHVESEPGQGTTFILRFPPVDGDPDEIPPPALPASQPPAGPGMILLVEDDDSVRRVATKILERAGYDVVGVCDAESGLERLRERDDVALVLTDLGLPGKSGREFVEEVSDTWPHHRILMMSGYAYDSPGHAEDLPADIPFLPKPFTPDGLLDAVHRTLRGEGG